MNRELLFSSSNSVLTCSFQFYLLQDFLLGKNIDLVLFNACIRHFTGKILCFAFEEKRLVMSLLCRSVR